MIQVLLNFLIQLLLLIIRSLKTPSPSSNFSFQSRIYDLDENSSSIPDIEPKTKGWALEGKVCSRGTQDFGEEKKDLNDVSFQRGLRCSSDLDSRTLAGLCPWAGHLPSFHEQGTTKLCCIKSRAVWCERLGSKFLQEDRLVVSCIPRGHERGSGRHTLALWPSCRRKATRCFLKKCALDKVSNAFSEPLPGPSSSPAQRPPGVPFKQLPSSAALKALTCRFFVPGSAQPFGKKIDISEEEEVKDPKD